MMADNYLERRYDDYQAKKAKWMLKKKHQKLGSKQIERPEDEAL